MVLVAAASKYGSTREVADAIARALNARGVEATAEAATEVSDVAPYDAVVLGSAIYGGRWLDAARKLAAGRGAELAARPTWLFSVGPIGDPPKPEDAGPDGIDELVEATAAREHRVFAGKLDFSKLRRVERLMVRALRAPEGDFRDWSAIESWAGEIAAAVRRKP